MGDFVTYYYLFLIAEAAAMAAEVTMIPVHPATYTRDVLAQMSTFQKSNMFTDFTLKVQVFLWLGHTFIVIK